MSKKYFGPYRGVVTDNADPRCLMRIRVTVATVPAAHDVWALPCVPVGAGAVPEVGDRVWVEFEAGDPSYPVWIGAYIDSESPPKS